jgi:hypothetical protein
VNLKQMIAQLRANMAPKLTERTELRASNDQVRAACVAEQRDPSETEAAEVVRRNERIAQIDAEIERTQAQITEYEQELERDEAADRLAREVNPTGVDRANQDRGLQVTEQRTYSREFDPNGEIFLRDVVADFLGLRGDHRDRLSQHEQEERAIRGAALSERAVTAAGAPGLVVPQYLVDMYAKKGRPGRKFADQCRHHDLPETGMTVYIPRQTALTSVDIQAAEMDTVSDTDYDDELIPVAVRTAAGSQTVSRQSAERSLGTLDITFEDLMRSYDSSLDNKLLNSATWGLLAVANAVTYTSGAPTAAELFVKIAGAQANAEDTLQDADEDDFFTLMRGRRWSWLKTQLTDKWPFMAVNGLPAQAAGVNDNVGYQAGIRGQLPDGGDVVTDNNLPNNLGAGTNEDIVAVVARQEAHLWEDPNAPIFIRAEQGPNVKKLGIDLVLYGYFAACFDRIVDAQGTPKAVHQKITGTGLVAPVF